ncbi:MAG: hypothetical protein IJL00_01790 [Clostridia bacterium]|nr:hypothetical protein [Clostridia bacterium]
MKHAAKTVTAFLLCLALLLPFFGTPFRAFAAEGYFVVYVRGSTSIYKFEADGSKRKVYDDGDYVVSVLTKALPLLPVAKATGNYDAYCSRVLEIMRPAYDDFRPSLEDGSVPADTRVDWYWNRDTLAQEVRERDYYEYWVDERLSPFRQAEDLNAFIETLQELTGKRQFLLYARCLGPVTAMTYLYEYQRPKHYEDVYGVELSYATLNGMAVTDAAYTGTAYIPPQALRSFLTLKTRQGLEGELPVHLADLLCRLVDGIAGGLGMKLTVDELNKLYQEFKDCLFQPLIKEYYGLCLNYMACVNDRFDEMMAYLFPTAEDKETYAYAVGELTRYHETVWPAIRPMLQEVLDLGKPMLIMADYGGQQYPLNMESEYLGDFQVGTKSMSFGAVTAKIGETLSGGYLASREAAGLGAYLSPDKKVDASTCAFRDRTFFIANFDHEWPGRYAGLELEMMARENFDVHSDPDLPQFLWYDREKQELLPLASVLAAEGEGEAPAGLRGVAAKIAAFFRSLAQWLRELLKIN